MNYLYIGDIVNTHGIKGELRIRSRFDKKEKVFIPKMILYIGKEKTPEEISSYRKHKEFDMVCFTNYHNINEVLKYLKKPVYVNKDDLNLEKDEYVLEELIGLNVIENNEILGKVKEIVYNNSNILLSIDAIKSFYIPHNKNFIKKVDLESKTIIVENAKGLIL